MIEIQVRRQCEGCGGIGLVSSSAWAAWDTGQKQWERDHPQKDYQGNPKHPYPIAMPDEPEEPECLFCGGTGKVIEWVSTDCSAQAFAAMLEKEVKAS